MRTGPGIVTGAFTTVLAFMTTATTEFTAFAELGIITSVGLIIMLVVTLLVVPAFTHKLQRSRDVTPPELPGTDLLTFLVRSTPRFLVITGVALAFMGALALGDIRFNYRYFDFLPQETESAQALLLLEDDLSMGPTFANLSTDSVESARKWRTEFVHCPRWPQFKVRQISYHLSPRTVWGRFNVFTMRFQRPRILKSLPAKVWLPTRRRN